MRVGGWLRVPRSVTQPRTILLATVALLAVVLPGSWFLHMQDRYHRTVNATEGNLVTTSRLLEIDLRIAVLATDMALGEILDAYRHIGTAQSEEGRQALQAKADELRRGLPIIASLWVVDQTGQVLAGSPQDGHPEALGQVVQTMVRNHRQGGGELDVEGAVAQGGEGDWFFTVGHPLDDGSGEVTAMAVATVDGAQLARQPDDERSRVHPIEAVFRSDGLELVPPPEKVQPSERQLAAAALQQTRGDTAAAAFAGVLAAGQAKHIVAFRRLEGLPLAVCASLSLDEALAGWRSDLRHGAGIMLVSLASLGALTLVVWRRIRDQEAARLQLATANRALEDRVQQRTRELEAARDTAERAAVMRSKFLSMASHDLRQPVQAMKTFYAVLENALTEPRMIRAIHQLGAALSSLEVLLDSVMNLSSLESGGMKAEIKSFPVDQVLSDVASQLELLAGNKGLTYRQVHCSCAVRSDPVLLARILRNLTINALRYTQRGKILVGCRHRGPMLSIEVWDTGRGIPKDKLAQIFEEFVRLRGQGDPGGIGLGLSIVAKAAALLDHPVAVRSQVGRGSVFAVEVPVVGWHRGQMRDAG